MREFTSEQLERYSRHILLKDVGAEGQLRIMESRILVIGAGGLGSPVALYLAAAGVGTIGIADGDVVDLSNLQRQVIHFTSDLGVAKVESARRKMTALNPDIRVVAHHQVADASTIRDLIDGYDFIVDCTDNFASKFLINDACVLSRKPFSHGGVLRFSGQTTTVIPVQSACYRCVFDSPPPSGSVPTCSQAGILGSVAGILGTVQATEALKYVSGAAELLTDSLLTFDAGTMEFRKVRIRKRTDCAVCGEKPSITNLSWEAPRCKEEAAG